MEKRDGPEGASERLYLTRGDVAKRANVVESAVRQWEALGKLRAVARTESGVRLFDPGDVETFLQARRERRK